MRRMYSEQELTKVIKEVFEAELASGALDEQVSDAVDAYLVEHPVDITALEGQDVELNSLDADGLITGGEIVEKMSGYAFDKLAEVTGLTREFVYAGCVKNGNKLTFVIACNYTRTDSIAGGDGYLGEFSIPSDVASKLYPTLIGSSNVLDMKTVVVFNDTTVSKSIVASTTKGTNKVTMYAHTLNELTLNTKYYVRYEVTFLLSENLISE